MFRLPPPLASVATLRAAVREACRRAHTKTRVDRPHRVCLSCGSSAVGMRGTSLTVLHLLLCSTVEVQIH